MASSAGYLSSTEPSSPTTADKNMKMYSSCDMSSSITSADEITNALPIAEELCMYFPKLDIDLDVVPVDLENEKQDSEICSSKDPEQESARSITPISISSDISTPLATKGSTTAADLTTDDDDEATLSVDTCLSLPISEKPTEKFAPSSPSPSLPPMTTNRVQKQISLYESEQVSAQEFKSMIPSKRLSDTRTRFYATESNSLSQFSSNDNIALAKFPIYSTTAPKSSKTKSCINLKSCTSNLQQQHHPGAIIVKEKFIDPPKRITSSFHGHTRYGSVDERKLQRDTFMMRASDPTMTSNNGNIRSRFVATKVTEDEKDDNE